MLKRALAIAALGTVAFAAPAAAQTYVGDDTFTRDGSDLTARCYEGIVQFFDQSGQLLGSAVADANGDVTFHLPPGVDPATVSASGTGCDDAPLTQTVVQGQPVGRALPRTGDESTVPLGQLGAGLLVAGAATLFAARRRQGVDAA